MNVAIKTSVKIQKLLLLNSVMSLKQLRDELKERSRSSLFRDLKKLAVISSYTHTGQYHALKKTARKVRKDATVSFNSQIFEVDYILAGRSIQLVVDPQANRVVSVESLDGKPIGQATPLDSFANINRKRQRGTPVEDPITTSPTTQHFNAIDLVDASPIVMSKEQ